MRRSQRADAARPPTAKKPATPGARRNRLATYLALFTIIGLGLTFLLAQDTRFLTPGPLTSAHSAIEKCSACHANSGSGNLSWVHGLVAGDRIADSKACLTCHKMPDTAFNAHGASAHVLTQSTERLTKIAATTPVPFSARAQSIASRTAGEVDRGLVCSTCHQEHKGANFDLKKISNEQCRSCHVVKFDSFDGDHPKFETYPFKRRTRMIYDHAGHFTKHFPEVATKDPTKKIPGTCSTCHASRDDKLVMAVAPFEQTCATCHLDQITGKDRASGPKGIAFLALPGLDLQTLKKRNAPIGEWPAESEAELTPFMKVMISRNLRGQALIKAVERLNLQDLSAASDAQIKAVTDLVWEIKRVFYALLSGKASDVLAHLSLGDGEKLSAAQVVDLTVGLPRDVIAQAHQYWLPNLGTEMANRPDPSALEVSGWVTKTTTQAGLIVDSATSSIGIPSRTTGTGPEAPSKSAPDTPPASTRAGNKPEAVTTNDPPRAKAADQTDDLLNPTEEEVRASAIPSKDATRVSPAPDRAVPADTSGKADAAPRAEQDTAASPPQVRTATVTTIESKVDPENWAEYGGWYRQDYAIFYRPAGHKDKFLTSWLALTGLRASKGDASPAAAVFASLTGKDAPGTCTKCHSVDEIKGKGRFVNFSPAAAESRKGRFTQFVHEPHFGVVGERGCLTCHSLQKGDAYLKSYEQSNPHSFASSFGVVNKDVCQTCHTSNVARQDCMTCHKYHVHGVETPIVDTKLPTE